MEKDGASTFATARGPEQSGLAKALSVLVLLSLLLSSFAILSQASVAVSPSSSGSAPPGHPSDSSGTTKNHAWDWKGLSDKSGYDSVILWSDGPTSARDLASKVASEVKRSEKANSTVDGSQPRYQIKGVFEHGFVGISAKMEYSSLEQLLASDPSIHAYPDLQVHALDVETDRQIGADQIWTQTDKYGDAVTGTGIVVSIIDTGIYYLHPDLGGGFGAGYKVATGWDFYNNDPDPMDDNGHGTHVAGIVAGSGGIEGVAPSATLYAYKALGADGSGPISAVIAAIDRSIDPNDDGSNSDHVNVISMSLGGSGDANDPLCLAVERAVEAGIVVVVAAGNSGPSMGTVASPGVSPYAVTVGAVDDTGALANFSSRGPTGDLTIKPDLSAPGVSVLSTVPYSGTPHSSSTGYMEMSGTSMATPHVSGAAALLLQLHPEWKPQQVKSALVTGARGIGESVWTAGSGELWLPTSAGAKLFASEPLVSYGLANGTSHGISISYSIQPLTLGTSSIDWYALSADGYNESHDWSNLSTVSPSSITIQTGQSAAVTLRATGLASSSEGYFDGSITLSSGSASIRISFGFVLLTRVTIHVRDMDGREVLDPYGGVWVYSLPNAEVAISRRGTDLPAPPATFMLPSGQYSAHAAGHQLVYTYDDPYLLSKVFTLGRVETRDVWINMTDAHRLTMNLDSGDRIPIFVKEFRVYARYVATYNYSFDLTGTDYSIAGSQIFNIPNNLTVYLSDTQATVGISIQGFAYSSGMWDFMKLNWQHIYEYTSSSSTCFIIESTADLQYLLAWEFPKVDGSVPTLLTYDINNSGVYVTKYDIPGTISSPWNDWGIHRSIGAESVFYVRRDTFTSVNPFFSGATRTTFVSGVFSELYYPQDLFSGYIERQFYIPDYTHLLKARSVASIYLPDRNFLTPWPVEHTEQRLGAGPFYASIYTLNSNDSMIFYNPLLRDQWGSRVGGMDGPMMRLFRSGMLAGTYQLSEFLARPDAKRIVSLTSPGTYVAKIDYAPFPDLFNKTEIDLGFSVPAADPDPPVITGMSMPQRFVPGEQVRVNLTSLDAESAVTVEMRSRAGGGSWTPLTVQSTGGNGYAAVIQTSATDSVLDLMVKVTDASGNFISYTAYSVAKKVTPVVFDIQASVSQVEYKNSGVSVVLTGHLTDSDGQPLDSTSGIPLELMVDGRKVGMILDEYVSGTTHEHNGNIQFNWVLRPTEIFSGPGQTKTVTVTFDLGTYAPVTRTFTLSSIPDTNTPPDIALVSPSNNTLVARGTQLQLSVTDDGTIVSSGYKVDGGPYLPLANPWTIYTNAWSDGAHTVKVYAVDDDGYNKTASFNIETDGTPPSLTITSPTNGSLIPFGGAYLQLQVSDEHLGQVTYSLDGMTPVSMTAPYGVDLSSLAIGDHSIRVIASDNVGNRASAFTSFEIASSSVVVSLVSPANGSIIKSGVSIVLSVQGFGALTCSWSENGVPHALSPPYQIDTSGWIEGTHTITVLASNDLGGQYQMVLTFTIDNTSPTITLESPSEWDCVKNTSLVSISISDANFKSVTWTFGGMTVSSTSPDIDFQLLPVKTDGNFAVIVTALDLAGNSRTEDYTFVMDNTKPVVEIKGTTNGAVHPGDILEVTATDMFLSGVTLAIGEGTPQPITVPYLFDTSQLSPGWYILNATATDRAGNIGWQTISLHVDGTPPQISMASGDLFRPNSSFKVSASLSDDSGIGSVTLYYSLPRGGFEAIPMALSGSLYSVTLSADKMWDGMMVYVVVSDIVGNTAEGARQTLHESATAPSGDDGTGGSSGMIFQESWLFSSSGLGSVMAVIVSAILLLFYTIRRRTDADDDHGEPPKEPKPNLSAAALIEAAKKKAVASIAPPKRPAEHMGLGRVAPISAVAKAETPKRESFSLLDALPSIRIRQEEMTEASYKTFMAQLEGLQRDMTALQRRRSVYYEGEKTLEDLEKELEKDLEEDEPKVVRGLQLRSILK